MLVICVFVNNRKELWRSLFRFGTPSCGTPSVRNLRVAESASASFKSLSSGSYAFVLLLSSSILWILWYSCHHWGTNDPCSFVQCFSADRSGLSFSMYLKYLTSSNPPCAGQGRATLLGASGRWLQVKISDVQTDKLSDPWSGNTEGSTPGYSSHLQHLICGPYLPGRPDSSVNQLFSTVLPRRHSMLISQITWAAAEQPVTMIAPGSQH